MPNNAVELNIWTAGEMITGNPLSGNGNIPPITDAKLVEWTTQRKLKGWVHSGTESELVSGGDRYTSDGTLPMTPETTFRSWYQRPLLNLWGSNNKTWFTRIGELGATSVVAMHTRTGSGGSAQVPFNAALHDNTAWGASTVAGALTPSGGFLADYIARCKSLKAAGYKGDGFDFETAEFTYPYTGMPGLSFQQVCDLVVLRAQQMAKIAATHLNVVGGPTYTCYYVRTTGSINELLFYRAQGGAVSDHIYDYNLTDLFLAGLACETGVQAVYLADATYYRQPDIPGNAAANDDHVTRYANAYSFDQGRRFAVWSQRLASCVTSGAVTAAQALDAIAKLNHCAFIWLTDNQEGWSSSPVLADMVEAARIMLKEAAKWSMARRLYVYIRVDGITESDPWDQFNQFEPGFATYLTDTVINDPPTVTITPVATTSNATVTVSGTATTNTVAKYFKVTNVTTGVSVMATKTWVNDSTNWNPLSDTAQPWNTALGRIPFHDAFTATVALAVGDNTIRVDGYSSHNVVGSSTTTITRTSTSLTDFTGSNGAAWPGWTTFAGTVDIQSNKGRTQTAAAAFGSAGAYFNTPQPQDYEWTGNATLTTVTAAQFYGAVNVRATANTFDAGGITQNGGWRILFVGGTGDGHAELYRISPAGAVTWLVSGPNNGFVQGSVLRLRINLSGTACKVRYWKDAETEPTTWGIDFNDPSAPTGTGMSVGCRSGGDSVADRWDWDDIAVSSGGAPPADPPPTPAPTSLQELFYAIYPSAATEIWVDGALGNDAATGTAVAPKATIQGAINASTAGSRIMVRPYAPGYATHNFAGHSGTATNYIQMVAPSGAIINANGGTATGSSATSMVGNANFIAVYGFEYVGINLVTSQYETGVVVANGAHDVAVWGCYFHDLASHAVCLPGNANQGWAGSDKIDFCYNRVTRCAKWNENQASGFSTIDMVPIGSAWADGYRNHIVGNVIDACWTDPSRDPPWNPGGPLSDGNCIILDHSAGYTGTGRTLIAHNLTVGAGGRGIHVLGHPRADVWLNTSCDNVQNLTGTWDCELSLFTSTGSNCQYNVAAARVGRNRVGLLTSDSSGSAWNNNVFVRGTGGSEANDPGVASNNNVNKTSPGPSGYFQAYQQGVYQSTVIANIAGFRPVAAQAATFAPPTNVRNAVSPWPDALGFNRPASGVWAHGAFEATATPPASSSGVHWGYSVVEDAYKFAGGGGLLWPGALSASARAALSSIPRTMITTHIGGFGIWPPETSNNVFDWTGDRPGGNPAGGLDDGVANVQAFTGATGIDAVILCSCPGWMKPSGLDFSMDEAPGARSPFTEAQNEQNFADMCGAIAARYPGVLWYIFWNEFKGLGVSGGAPGGGFRWNYQKYTRMYNLARASILAANPLAKVGGPYPVHSSIATGGSGNQSSYPGTPSCTFTGGFIDFSALDCFTYFRDNAIGWDFIACDIYAGNQFGAVVGSGATAATQSISKFVNSLNWIRTHIEPVKPIVIAESYPIIGGFFNQTQAEDHLLAVFAAIRDNVDVQQGIYSLAWGEQDEPPLPFDYTTGAATGLIQKLINWEASQ